MASYDRQFEILNPSLDRLIRRNYEVNVATLVDPSNAGCLLDGELCQLSNGKIIRATDPDKISFACLEERGDYGIQASKRPALVMGQYIAQTIIFVSTGLSAFGVKMKMGSVTLGGNVKSGLVLHDSTHTVVGYVMKPATAGVNGGRLEYLSAAF